MSFSLLSSPPPPLSLSSFSTNHHNNHHQHHPLTLIPLRKLSISRSSSFSPIPDEWGDKLESELNSSLTRFTKPDPSITDDEWNPVSPLKDLVKDVTNNISDVGKDVVDIVNDMAEGGPASTITGLVKDVVDDIAEVELESEPDSSLTRFTKPDPPSADDELNSVSPLKDMVKDVTNNISDVGKDVVDIVNDMAEVGPAATLTGLGKDVVDDIAEVVLESEPDSSLIRFTEPDPPIADDEWKPVLPLKDVVKDVTNNISDVGKDVVDTVNDIAEVGPASTITGLGKDVVDDIAEVAPVSKIEGLGKDVTDGVGEVDSVSRIDGLGREVLDEVGDELEKIRRAENNMELKRCLIDSVLGSDLGFSASSEVRAEVAELVSQLEAGNPTPNPTEVPLLLQGKWVLVYTAFSELLPLLAVGNTTSFLKIQQISQSIDIGNSIVENSTTLSTPFANFSFSASASFEVRTPSRIQVRFKEATFNPPQIKSNLDIPENLDVFGQKIPLPPAQQVLNPVLKPVQEAAGNVSGVLFGLPPLKIPIPGERTESWLLVTYLDADFRISRGDGGLFVLVREGSPLLM